MGAFFMEASQINYRGGSEKMSVEDALKKVGKSGVEYKTTEYDTNCKWIDGRTIYGRIFPLTEDDQFPTSTSASGITETGLQNIDVISIKGIIYLNGKTTSNPKMESWPIPKFAGNGGNCIASFDHRSGNIELVAGSGTAFVNAPDKKGFIEIQYCYNPESEE